MDKPIEIENGDNNDILESNHNHNITHLQFDCEIASNSLSHITNYYTHLNRMEFINCNFDNSPEGLPFVTEIDLPNTRIMDNVCLVQNDNIRDEDGGLVLQTQTKNTMVLMSIISVEQEFEKRYICTRSLVEEVNKDMFDVIAKGTDVEHVAFVKIKAQYIKSLSFEVIEGKQMIFDINLKFSN